MIENPARLQGFLALFHRCQELPLGRDIGPQRLVDESGFATPRRFGQAFKLVVEVGIDPGGDCDGFRHASSTCLQCLHCNTDAAATPIEGGSDCLQGGADTSGRMFSRSRMTLR